MSPPRCRSRAPRATGGFTLIEIVMVLAVMVALAGLVVSSMQGVHEQAALDLARHELNEVRRAVLQFKADTGFLPRRGPFNLVGADPLANEGTAGLVQLTSLLPAASPAERQAWFDAPENLFQLFLPPPTAYLDTASGHPLLALAAWDAGRRRGWRGPYLTANGEGRLGGPGRPPVPAVADPFVHASHTPWFTWADPPTEEHLGLAPRRAVRLVGVDGPDARVVSAGPDGLFDGDAGPSDDDVVYHLLR